MITVQIMQGEFVVETHDEPSPKAAQEYAAHWTYEMITGGWIGAGAVLTYLIIDNGEVIDIVSYLHAEDADITVQ